MDNKEIDYRAIIRQYYRSFKETDRQTLQDILVPDFRHVSSYAVYSNRDQMIDDIWPEVGNTWASDLKIFGEGPEFMVRYHVTGEGRPATAMAEYIRFEEDKIAEIEVFMGRELDQSG